MRILITGGGGFIGSHLAEYHLSKGDEVYAVDDLSTGSIDNVAPLQKNPKFRFEKADILTWPGLEKAVGWAERIYHMAAIVGIFRVLSEPLKLIDTNISGYMRLLDTVSKSQSKPWVVVASSSSVYGHSKNKVLNEDDDLIFKSPKYPLGSYALTKLTDEVLSLGYIQEMHLAITVVRIFNTVGPRQTGQYGMVVPRFIREACRHKPITVFGDGGQTRSFCDVRDTVRALALLAENKATSGDIINVGNDREISINDLAKMVNKLAESKAEIQHKTYQEAYGKPFIDIQNRRPDLTKLFKYTSFEHAWSLEETIADLIARYRSKK